MICAHADPRTGIRCTALATYQLELSYQTSYKSGTWVYKTWPVCEYHSLAANRVSKGLTAKELG